MRDFCADKPLPAGVHPTDLTELKRELVDEYRDTILGGKHLAAHVFDGPFYGLILPANPHLEADKPPIIASVLEAFEPVTLVHNGGHGASPDLLELRILPELVYQTIGTHSDVGSDLFIDRRNEHFGPYPDPPTQRTIMLDLTNILPISLSLADEFAAASDLTMLSALLRPLADQSRVRDRDYTQILHAGLDALTPPVSTPGGPG